MNRTVNDGMKFNAAKDMLPFFNEKVDFSDYLSKAANVEKEAILGFDLFLVNRDKPRRVGLEKELLSSPKLDDLASCYATFYAFLDSEEEKEIPIFAAFDNEEVGSMTRQGANSTFLQDTIDRLSKALEIEKDQAIAASIALSIDNAHANHPNHPRFRIRRRMCDSETASSSSIAPDNPYTTDALSSAIVKAILEKRRYALSGIHRSKRSERRLHPREYLQLADILGKLRHRYCTVGHAFGKRTLFCRRHRIYETARRSLLSTGHPSVPRRRRHSLRRKTATRKFSA